MDRREGRTQRRKQQAVERRDANDGVNRRPKRDRAFVENWMIGALAGVAFDLATAIARWVRERRSAR
jgi:hypothetical protein